jgi:hypothetical protein
MVSGPYLRLPVRKRRVEKWSTKTAVGIIHGYIIPNRRLIKQQLPISMRSIAVELRGKQSSGKGEVTNTAGVTCALYSCLPVENTAAVGAESPSQRQRQLESDGLRNHWSIGNTLTWVLFCQYFANSWCCVCKCSLNSETSLVHWWRTSWYRTQPLIDRSV